MKCARRIWQVLSALATAADKSGGVEPRDAVASAFIEGAKWGRANPDEALACPMCLDVGKVQGHPCIACTPTKGDPQ